MTVCHTLFCFLFIALQDGNIGLVDADNRLHTRQEGQSVTVRCQFAVSGRKRFFCRETCDGGNILIETTKDTDQRGRYSIKYEEGSFPSRDTILSVSIRQLKKSDSGRYRCSLEKSFLLNPSMDFRLVVEEAPTTSQPNLPLRPSTSPESREQLDSPPARSDLLLYVGLILVVKVFILSMPLMIFCKKRRSTRPKVPPVETDHIYVSVSGREIEEIREEDGQSSSPPVEIFSIYCNAKYTKPNGAEDTSAQPAVI